MALTLRPPGPDDEAACLAAQGEFESFPFLLHWEPGLEWSRYLDHLEGLRRRTRVPEGPIPEGPVPEGPIPENPVPSTFLLAEVDGALVGRASVRFSLNDFLAARGGHIGYGVRPAFRRRGYATAILQQAVAVARAEGVGRILVVCDDDNEGSARVIERCGGVLESVVTPAEGVTPFRRYWID